MDFTSGLELLTLCKKNNLNISDVMLKREITEGRLENNEIIKMLNKALSIMENASNISIIEPQKSMGGLSVGKLKSSINILTPIQIFVEL